MGRYAVCVAILDEDSWDARTDVLVLVDARRKTLTWVPRDLWCAPLGDRINTAFARGRLLADLAALGFSCTSLLCLRRGATIAALSDLAVDVPVEKPLRFWYPLAPLQPIEDGRKLVTFNPPSEHLSGERLHQWLGARYSADGPASELIRLPRQIAFLRALLASHADFRPVLADPDRVRIEGNDPLPILTTVTADWRMQVFDRLQPAIIDGKHVYLPMTPSRAFMAFAKRLVSAVSARLRRLGAGSH